SKKNEKINSIGEIDNAPLYHGDLTLVGVLKHTDESKSIAIIDTGMEQKTYFIGDAIENINIFIVKIFIDKITISDGTTYYSLILLE
ncbi:type II secretion system protein N, partial [Yersinia intermedia]